VLVLFLFFAITFRFDLADSGQLTTTAIPRPTVPHLVSQVARQDFVRLASQTIASTRSPLRLQDDWVLRSVLISPLASHHVRRRYEGRSALLPFRK
jgi:hypothetical protein